MCVCVCVCVLVAQSWPALCDPMDCSLQAPLSMEFSRQEYWSGLPFPSPGDLFHLGIKPGSPSLQADSLLCEPPWKPKERKTYYFTITPLLHFCESRQTSDSINENSPGINAYKQLIFFFCSRLQLISDFSQGFFSSQSLLFGDWPCY